MTQSSPQLKPSLANVEDPTLSLQRFVFPQEEERILAFWKEVDAFRTSLRLSEGRKRFSFYDGPPFATGLPHYGHLLAGTIKVRGFLGLSSGYHLLPLTTCWTSGRNHTLTTTD